MARLWRNDPAVPGGFKYLVQRRDGTVPEWPSFVLGGRDPAAPAALRAYAAAAAAAGSDPAYVADVRALADEFERYRAARGAGDPDPARHRPDDPAAAARMTGCGDVAPPAAAALGAAAQVLELGRALDALAKDHAAWSRVAFGDDLARGPVGALKHLEEEAREAQAAPHDRSEYADCLLLVLDAARRAGMTPYDLVLAAQKKMLVNRLRVWPAPAADEPARHLKFAPPAAPPAAPQRDEAPLPRPVAPDDPAFADLDDAGRLALAAGDEVAVATDSGKRLAFVVSAAPWQMYGGTWALGLAGVAGCYLLGRVVARRVAPAPVHAGEWGALPAEPCRYCRKCGGVEFLIDSGPEGKAGLSPVRCHGCGRSWAADSTSA
jgi:hypothetical protein